MSMIESAGQARKALPITARVQLAMLAIALVVAFIFPFLASTFILRLVTLALVSALFAMSVDLMAGYAGLVSLGHAGVLGSAMYGVGYVASKTDGGFALQLLVGFAAGIAASVIFGLMAMRSSGVYFILITIAQGMIVWGLATLLVKITGAENGLPGIRRPVVVETEFRYYFVALIVVLVSSVGLFIVVRSPVGFALKGLRESETRMRMLGHNTTWLKFQMFMLSGFFATIAGILLVYLNEFVNPTDVIIASSALPVLMSILGGIGTLIGPFIGAFVVVFLRNYVSLEIDRWQSIMGLTFIFVVLFARDGLIGAVKKHWYKYLDSKGSGPAALAATEMAAPPLQSG